MAWTEKSENDTRQVGRPRLAVLAVLTALAAWLGLGLATATPAAAVYAYQGQWGKEGSGPGEFRSPNGLATDSAGNVYVADSGNNRIQKFSSGGGYIAQWGNGGGEGALSSPSGVAVDGSGNVYVADTGDHRIKKYSSGGGYITQWGSLGTGAGEFEGPYGVGVDGSGNVYVADTFRNRIQKFNSTGGFITKWGTYGSGNGEFFWPQGVAGGSGGIYVADNNNHRVQRFDTGGGFVETWGRSGGGNGEFSGPTGIATDSSGNVYVTDFGNARVQQFTASGGFVEAWGSSGEGDGQFRGPFGIAVSGGSVYVSDLYNNRIQRFGVVALDTSITDGPNALTGDNTPTFSFSSTLGGSSFECRVDGSGFSGCSSPYTTGTLGDGAHTFEVRAVYGGSPDPTPASRSFTVDATPPPTPTITGSTPKSPSNRYDPLIYGTGAESGTEVRFWKEDYCGGPVQGHGSAEEFNGEGVRLYLASNETSWLRVRAIDAAGNISGCSGPFGYTEDSRSPQTTIDSGPPASTSSTEATFTFGADEEAVFECRLDGATFESCGSPRKYTGLAEGSHSFEVRATDAAGNTDTSPAQRPFVVDLTPPETTITGSPPGLTNQKDVAFSFSSSEGGSTFQCKLDAGSFEACTSPKSYTGLVDNPHRFEVRATDAAGNTDMSAAASEFTVDTTAPLTTIESGPSGPTSENDPIFTFFTSEAATLYCQLEGSAAPCTSPRSYTDLADGTYTFFVFAIDQAGNTGAPVSRRFTIDTTAPPQPTVEGTDPPSPANDNAPKAMGAAGGQRHPDLAVANYGVSILLGGAGGTFASGPQESAAGSSRTVAVGDFNGDDDPDLAVANGTAPGSIAILAGEPGGGFSLATNYSLGETPDSVSVGDFNGDGDPDLAAPLGNAEAIAILLGGPGPTFGAPTRYATGYGPKQVAIGDFNGDGDPDLAVAVSAAASAGVLLGSTGGTFTAYLGYYVGAVPLSIGVGDFNGDGDPDLAVALSGANSVAILRGSTGGTFYSVATLPAGNTPQSVAVGDFDGDGDPDLAVANWDGQVSILLGGPGTTFTSPTSYPTGANSTSVAIGDFDGDGDPDLAVANRGSANVSILLGGAGGSFGTAANYSIPLAALSVATGEFDADATRVRIYADDEGCGGGAAAEGSRSAFEGPGIAVAVADNHTTQIRARAVDAAGNVSTCSSPLPYTEDSIAPETTIASGPAAVIGVDEATFGFGSEAGASFECRLDDGGFEACGSPKGYTDLADGPHSFEVRALDAAGNADTSPASRSFTVDTTEPETTIDSGPDGPTNSASPSFGFSSNEAEPTFRCSLDGGSFGACSSPKAYAGLAEGPHSFEVRALDAAGNVDATPASRSFTVDLTPPETTIDSGPNGPIAHDHPAFAFSSDEAGGFECRLDDGGFEGCGSPKEYSGLADGPHSFEVRALDTAGNPDTSPASRSFTVDTAPPDTQIDSGPGGPTSNRSPSFAFSSEAGASFQCRLDGGDFEACGSPKGYTDLADGPHSFEVRALDAAGNPDGSPASRSFTVDTAPPDTQIDSGPDGPTSSRSPSFAFSSEAGASFQCRLDGGDFEACGSPKGYTDLADGPHSFEVRALDTAGNPDTSPASRSFTVDTGLPDTQIDSGPSGPIAHHSPSFEFSSNEADATFQCRLEGGGFEPCASPKAYGWLGEGGYTFEVRALDAAGNPDDSPASRSFTVDTTSPETTIESGPSGPTNDRYPTFEFTSSEPGSTFQCRAGGSWSNCASPKTYYAPSDGTYTVEVRATDAAGNTDPNPASRTFTVDTAVPETTIESGPSGATSNRNLSFQFTSSESGSSFECRLGGSWSNCTSPQSYYFYPDGSATFEVRATDQAGNTDQTPASRSFSVDTTEPQTTVDSGPNGLTGNASPSFEFSSNEAGASFQCRLDYSIWSACGSPKAYSGLANGTHQFEVRATDAAGNADGSPANRSFTVDTAPPETTIASGPSGVTGNSNPSFGFSSSESGSNFECRLDDGSFSTCSTPKAFAGLADGAHSFEVRATDAVGNVDTSPASRSFTVDTAPPETTIQSGPPNPTNDWLPSFAFSASESGSSFECRLDFGSWRPCSSPDGIVAESGDHTYSVRAIDPAGNVDQTPATWNFTEDQTEPETTIDSGPSGLTNDNDPSFGFSANEGGSSFECRLDHGGWSACTSPQSYPSLGNGSHTFEVRATDPAGNIDFFPASRSFTVDAQAPAPPRIGATEPPSPANRNDPWVRGSGAEAGSTVRVYDGACAGTALATGSAEDFNGGRGLQLALGDDRTYHLTTTATDAAGNTSACSAVFDYSEDSTAPGATILSGPSGTISSTQVAFEFTSNESPVEFQCTLDGGQIGPCSSPKGYSGLSAGDHEFILRATDRAGNTGPTPATRRFFVDVRVPAPRDTTPPTLALLGKKKQDIAKKKGVAVKLRCVDEPCTARVQAKVVGAGRKLKLKALTVRLAPGGTKQVKLKASKKVRRKVTKALAAHRKPKAKVAASATDAAGNAAKRTKTIRLIPSRSGSRSASNSASGVLGGLLNILSSLFG